MTTTQSGIAVGATLALVWILFGFWPFVGVAAAMTVGALVGRIVEGRLDVSSVVSALTGRRSSS